MLSLRHIAALLLLAFTAQSSSAQITLDADFDHGSLDEVNSSVAGSFVSLSGRDNHNPGSWKWLYFSADGVNGLTPTFQIDDNFVTGGGNLNAHEMVYSYDQQNWSFFDNNARNAGADTFTFSNSSPFTSNQVYVAYGLPYSLSQAETHTNAIASSPYVLPTTTGGADLVLGQSPGGIDDLGRVIPANDLVGYRITDEAATGNKAKIVLAGGVHANETLGNRTLEAMVDYLLSDDLGASLLRRKAEFFVYPMVNPDGRLAGYNRSTVEHVNLDPNRSWDPPNYDGQSEIALIGDAMIADTGADVDFFIDFHSTVQKGSSHFSFIDIDRNFHLNPFWQRLLELEPTIDAFDAALINDTGAKFGLEQLAARFTMTFETRYIAGENADRFVTLGENFGRAFSDIFASPIGDINLDGFVDGADWLQFAASAQMDLSGLDPATAYAAGDLDGNGWNDVDDFALFKSAYENENGIGAFARLLAGAPEPNTSILLFAGCFCMTFCRFHTPFDRFAQDSLTTPCRLTLSRSSWN